MLRFYWSLIRELPAAFRDAAEAWGFWVWTIGAPALVLLNPQLDRWINTPPFSRRFVLVPIALSVGYVMLRANYRRFEDMRQIERPITQHDWMAMANEFKSVQDLAVRANWHKDPDQESWYLVGNLPEATAHTEALCQRAGEMLLASPGVASKLSDRVRAHADPVDRWLQFVREQPRTHVVMIGLSTVNDGVKIPTDGGHIENIPVVSARVCVECSSREI